MPSNRRHLLALCLCGLLALQNAAVLAASSCGHLEATDETSIAATDGHHHHTDMPPMDGTSSMTMADGAVTPPTTPAENCDCGCAAQCATLGALLLPGDWRHLVLFPAQGITAVTFDAPDSITPLRHFRPPITA